MQITKKIFLTFIFCCCFTSSAFAIPSICPIVEEVAGDTNFDGVVSPEELTFLVATCSVSHECKEGAQKGKFCPTGETNCPANEACKEFRANCYREEKIGPIKTKIKCSTIIKDVAFCGCDNEQNRLALEAIKEACRRAGFDKGC
ncbi:hypothetical protein JNK13_09300 [bacterium]|nr:hypothetical protein [bacterium]